MLDSLPFATRLKLDSGLLYLYAVSCREYESARLDSRCECPNIPGQPVSNVCKPVDVRREFGFQKRVVMVVTCECTTQEENDFVDTRNDSIFYRMSFFFPL